MNTVSCRTQVPQIHRHATKPVSTVRHNVYEGDKGFFIEFAIPGFAKEDFALESTRNSLKVSFTKPVNNAAKSEHVNRGFYYDSFERTFKLNPHKLDFETISASYENGILRIEVPKTEAEIKASRSIPVH